MEQKSDKKGLAERVLGGKPTRHQEFVFRLMVMSLVLWPLFFFMSLFIFDAPVRTTVDEISRWGATLTIWLYPVYLSPLMRLFFRLSQSLKAKWLFYLCPLIPFAAFFLFMTVVSSEFAERKPEGYDSSTFKRLNEAYATDINHVYYGNEILEGADPASFRVLSEDYAADRHRVWYNMYVIEGANPNTFVAPEKSNIPDFFALPLAHDDHDYYNGANRLHVADMGSFKRKGDCWAIDNKNVYYFGMEAEFGKNVPIGDYHSFRALNDCYAADAQKVYYKNKIVEGADPETFAPLKDEPHYGQDKHRVYCQARGSSIRNLNKLKHKNMKNGLWEAFHTDGTTVYNPDLMAMPAGTDFATIHKVERYREWYADNKRVYYENRLLPGANPQTFKIFPCHDVSEEYVSDNNKDNDYSHDGNRVYYRDSLMQGADAASFICGYDYVESKGFAFDKNRYYEGSPNPRLEKLRKGK